jgi:hypothetical protein
MCPVCITTAVLVAGGVASAGKLAVKASKKSGGRKAADYHVRPAASLGDHPG